MQFLSKIMIKNVMPSKIIANFSTDGKKKVGKKKGTIPVSINTLKKKIVVSKKKKKKKH